MGGACLWVYVYVCRHSDLHLPLDHMGFVRGVFKLCPEILPGFPRVARPLNPLGFRLPPRFPPRPHPGPPSPNPWISARVPHTRAEIQEL